MGLLLIIYRRPGDPINNESAVLWRCSPIINIIGEGAGIGGYGGV